MGRKSVPFWKLLGEHNVGCTMIRVPITFPPEPFNGKLLSAMCTPDLRGTQGSFSLLHHALETAAYECGIRCPLRRNGDYLDGILEGPTADDATLSVPFQIHLGNALALKIDGQSHILRPGEYSPWIKIAFSAAPGFRVHGIVRFLRRAKPLPSSRST